ncbi:metallophosphoesterase [Deinococcus hopiensis]|uniref:metallophosphoesterase n=1 Tax=Deinococcus hopiensis TaxID=309885 RepID=UPI0014822F0F|nr:metallophosphoesterase [Deinococcus hopiensis]
MRSVVIPDLHGCPQFLEWVQERFPGRHLILLGDLIHRGPDSRRTLRLALRLAEEGRARLLWGNHEHWVWQETARLSPSGREKWFRREGHELFAAYGGNGRAVGDVMHDLGRFARLARPYHVEGKMLCAHAARPSLGRTPDELLDRGYLWDRPKTGLHPLPTHVFPELRYSVHGHTPQPRPLVDLEGQGVVYLDLGSARTGRFCVWDAQLQRVVLYREGD